VAEQAVKADELVDEAKAAGGGDHPVTVHSKVLRLAPQGEGDLQREFETWSLNCTKCGLDVHWVAGLGVTPSHRAHGELAPHGEPSSRNKAAVMREGAKMYLETLLLRTRSPVRSALPGLSRFRQVVEMGAVEVHHPQIGVAGKPARWPGSNNPLPVR
jgi:hypothetical protein